MTIKSPSSGNTVASPFTLAATGSTCSSQNITSMSYSLDTSPSAVVVKGASLNLQVIAAAGAHTVNVTALGSSGASCSASVAIIVAQPAHSQSATVPANAISVSSIQALGNWKAQNDPATGGSTMGAMSMVSSPSLSGSTRKFDSTFSGSAGELYHITFGNDTAAHNFLYDVWVYFDSSASTIANLEMDMNQVIANGQTVIYGFQCDGYSGTWDYTANTGTPTKPIDHWIHSSAPCNPRKWERNAWHHIQIGYSRDDAGNVTYGSVWLDGAESKINATVPSAFALGWNSVLLANFQVDSTGSGANTVYIDNMTIARW